ncbi:MAG: dihydroorotase [Gammaproteobacteria bacterium]|nr:dihydroorotase [Gammaproteobacteria bacterium]NNM13961.1 dihydroorotase [Gammaproteobacteria bacterium]
MELNLIKPDDMHLHLRDGAAMRSVLPHTAAQFGRAIVMPNLKPPVTTVESALGYRDRILAALPEGSDFTPLMTLYLTDSTQVSEIHKVADSEHIQALKLYPAGATTNSAAGVTNIENTFAVLEAMSDAGIPLLIHGEALVDEDGHEVDVFDREKVFIDKTLIPLHRRFPDLRIVLEHITTRDAVQFVNSATANVVATITPQHLMHDRNAIFQGGIRPHFYCLPILKRKLHQEALVEAATSDNKNFFLGTDSAPHSRSNKENACGCAGIYSAHAALEFYAEVFEQANALDKLEAFASIHGAEFYGLEQNAEYITMRKEPWHVPESYDFGGELIIPFHASNTLQWKVVHA